MNNYHMLTESKVNEIVEQKLADKSKTTVWYNPESRTYWKANNPKSLKPSYDIFVCNGATVGQGLAQLKGASNLSESEIDKLRFSGISPEFVDQANRFWSAMDKAHKSAMTGNPLGAGVITTADYSDIANVMVDSSTLELIARDFVLEQMVTRKTSANIEYTTYNYTPYLNEADMGENDVMDPRSIDYDQFQITLKKAQGHVKASRWAEMTVRDRNVTQDNFRLVDADFGRIFAQEIATTLATFANNGVGGAYDVIGAGDYHSTTNPATAFIEDSGTIRTAGGNANHLAMNTETFQTLIQNTFMRVSSGSVLGAIPPIENTMSRITSHPMLPGYKIGIDELLTTGSIYIYDVRGIEFITGPTRTATVNDDYGNFTSQIHDRWYGSGVRVSGFGVEQTGTVT
ncbi:MAG: hypothetical protein CV087_08835 [Candidatus Brocadia sp. WS118]|nr:MAG: hypothetical protein CV087_08835 [Candidatus Brocadia sp. WS118]